MFGGTSTLPHTLGMVLFCVESSPSRARRVTASSAVSRRAENTRHAKPDTTTRNVRYRSLVSALWTKYCEHNNAEIQSCLVLRVDICTTSTQRRPTVAGVASRGDRSRCSAGWYAAQRRQPSRCAGPSLQPSRLITRSPVVTDQLRLRDSAWSRQRVPIADNDMFLCPQQELTFMRY